MDTTALPGSSLEDTSAPPPGRRSAVPPLCETGVILRALLFVEAAVAVAAGFGAGDFADWLQRTALGAAVAVPATLGWLVVACSVTGALARVPAWARLGAAAVLGGAAAWAACMPLRIMGMRAGESVGGWSVAGAGALLGAAVYHWLELRQRATLPAATEARLVELQARVRPHFLFNALNTAIALVRVDPARAEEVLEDLSELFRAALGAMEGDSNLGEEIRLARMYLDIEGMRFGQRLAVEWDIDEAAHSARVPPLVLQPLVENAVRHGVEPNVDGGSIQVRTRVHHGRARVQVTNTVGEAAAPGHGIGLEGVRERLRLMHDLDAQFEAGRLDDGRYRVRLAVPAGPAPALAVRKAAP